MTGGERAIPATTLLKNAASEAKDMDIVVRRLEAIVCELLSRDPSLLAVRGPELQAIDLLGQRLSGLAAFLALLAAPDGFNQTIAETRLQAVLPLEAQRSAILRGRPAATANDLSPELF